MKETRKESDVMAGNMKMKDLARLSGVNKSTIHHYLSIGLLHPPKRLGLSLSVYDWTHLSKLKRIRQLRQDHHLPLTRIKEQLATENFEQALPSPDLFEHEAETLISELEEEKRITRARKSERKRIEIMDAAIPLFNKHGYEKTTIEALAESLHVAKSTVYLYFESKEDLFMECMERLTVVAVPEEAWDEIREEKNALRRLEKRGVAFHKAFPRYRGILTMAKGELGGDNPKTAEKAKQTLSHMTQPIAKDLRRGMTHGEFREVDEQLVGHLILGMGEGLGCRLMMDSRYTLEQGVKTMFDLIAHGILRHDPEYRPKFRTATSSAQITDVKGIVTRVEKVRFGETGYLPLRMGQAVIKIDPTRLREIRLRHEPSSFWAEITASDGQTERTEIDPTLTLTGQVSFGEFTIEFGSLDRVLFDDGGAIPQQTHQKKG